MIKTIPKKQKCKKAKWMSEEALQIAVNMYKNGTAIASIVAPESKSAIETFIRESLNQ